MKNKFTVLLLAAVVALQSCDDDESGIKLGSSTINRDQYTAGNTLVLIYSADNGANFSTTLPDGVKKGTKVLVKVYNGSKELLANDFAFDWSGSIPAPTDATADVAEFVTGSEKLTVNVTVKDKITLITSHRSTGRFYSLDQAEGDTTYLFTPTFNGDPLKSVRGFVYHYNKELFYVTQNTDVGGYLYTIDPSGKTASRINENDGENGADVWDAVVNWAVAADDSLISVGDFNSDGNGIVKFGTDGKRSTKTAEVDICCGLGMIHDAATAKMQVASSWDTDDGELIFHEITDAGVVTDTTSITTMQNFPSDISGYWLTLRSMAKNKYDNTVYGILYIDSTKATYFVKVDLAGKSVTYIATLGTNNNNQFNSLAFVPNYTLH
jgi:hypothetical protein